MYLQITTKCNMTCEHCCYSCRPGRGQHADFATVVDMIAFARNRADTIAIGGGEPTLHPRFFDILKMCLEDFDYVWMATNGSQTKTMRRLANIIHGCDYESFELEDYCSCDPEDRDDCYCEPDDFIYQENKLSVALSQDYFHEADKVDPWVVDYWTRMAKADHSHFEIRNVTQSHDGVAAQGRAKTTGAGWGEHCVCSDLIIRPDGAIKACGCARSPIIGHVGSGIESAWEDIIDSDKFRDNNCYRAYRQKGGKRP